MRRHSIRTRNAVMDSVLDEINEQDAFGRLARSIPQHIKARAEAEWSAMDDEGRLPDGWAYEGDER